MLCVGTPTEFRKPEVTQPHTDCTPEEVHTKREVGEAPFVLDVRTHPELDIAKLDFAAHIPMDEIPERVAELEHRLEQEIIVMCHHGGRSARVRDYLVSAGFKNVRNLVGGIEAYACRIDTSLNRY
jgi:rhodanese-related sulfurtransferase